MISRRGTVLGDITARYCYWRYHGEVLLSAISRRGSVIGDITARYCSLRYHGEVLLSAISRRGTVIGDVGAVLDISLSPSLRGPTLADSLSVVQDETQ